MINKRLLIKNLLAHNDENSFYDKKRKINFELKEGKAKFLKHVCALSNSNPNNNSYIVIGVEDEDNKIIGVAFFDDSKIQNLVNAYLTNPPTIQYENIPFPHLTDHKVVGLVTIRPNTATTLLKKNIWKYLSNTIYYREGSISMPKIDQQEIKDDNSKIVGSIENHAKNNIEYTLNGVFDFMQKRQDYNPRYKVFKEYFVLCWSGQKKEVKEDVYYSRVDIALVNEQVRLFYSTLDEVSISYNKDSFTIIEYVQLGIENKYKYYPLEKTTISFNNNANYNIQTTLLFNAPQFDKKALNHIFDTNNSILEKLKTDTKLNQTDLEHLINLPATYLICHLNKFENALNKLNEAKPYLKNHPEIHLKYKESLRILRKMKYN